MGIDIDEEMSLDRLLDPRRTISPRSKIIYVPRLFRKVRAKDRFELALYGG